MHLITAHERDNLVISFVDCSISAAAKKMREKWWLQLSLVSYIYTEMACLSSRPEGLLKGILRHWGRNGYELVNSKQSR